MFEDIRKKWNRNFRALEEGDKKAKGNKSLVGRYIQEQYADGHAFYKIVKENKRTVVIQSIKGLGDDWIIPYWGKKATIDKQYAIMSIDRREALAKIFG